MNPWKNQNRKFSRLEKRNPVLGGMTMEKTMWKTKRWSWDIEEVMVENETDKSVWVRIPEFGNSGRYFVRQERKISESQQFHNTCDEAVEFLRRKLEKLIDVAEQNIASYRGQLEKLGKQES
jgi:hypothetical protein